MPSTTRESFLSTSRLQNWTLPDSLIYYVAKNPRTAKKYLDLIHSCKYFFIKNAILVVDQFIDAFDEKQNRIVVSTLLYRGNDCKKSFNMKFLKDCMFRIWPVGVVCIKRDDNFISSDFSIPWVSKIYQCDATYVRFKNYKTIDLTDFVLLCSKCETFSMEGGNVKNENGFAIPLEKLVDSLPNLKHLSIDNNGADPKNFIATTVSELIQVPHFSNLAEIWFYGIGEMFDIEKFYSYFMKTKMPKICLFFSSSVSNAYRTRLLEIHNEIKKSASCNIELFF